MATNNLTLLDTEEPRKRCCKCHEWLPNSCFHKSAIHGLQSWCRSCRSAFNKEEYAKQKAANPNFLEQQNWRIRNNTLVRTLNRYGLTQEAYEALSDKGCAICGGPPNGRGRYHFDHDHKTGKFRGLLCHLCNVGIGHFREDTVILTKAISYLRL